tara:strand:- start:6 stop:1721 length:1716 start_codon:yes stop_codon:yes gene_type:complete
VSIFYWFNLYQSVIRFIGLDAFWSVTKAVTLYSLVYGLIIFLSSIPGVPRSVILINWILALLVISGLRLFARWLLINKLSTKSGLVKNNVVIYGAGEAGRQLSLALKNSQEYFPAALIDDQPELQGRIINGIKVYSPDNLEQLIKNKLIKAVLIAIPSLSRARRQEIIRTIKPYNILVRSLPGVSELAQGKIKIEDLKSININDVLGRSPAPNNRNLLRKNIEKKVIMVTGSGGSIGSELCRQILFLRPKILILFDVSEAALYSIHSELLNFDETNVEIIPILGSVTNKNRLAEVFKFFKVQTIYHAAAYKHVPMVEFNNAEGVNNNIFGTLNCAQTAIEEGVNDFVLISTDKAVRPTNTMGTTKRVSEMILQAFSNNQKITCFTIVRFGNVLGSSGSVIPLFEKQIKAGGPVTVTNENMIRYFMTIPEAVELVIQAGVMGKGGDVFVLDMGEPMSIKKLAEKMIILSGLEVKNKSNPNGDIEIHYTGLRPGEKLFEELLIGSNVASTDNPLIMCAKEEMLEWNILKPILDELDKATKDGNYKEIRKLLINLVPEFEPQCEITDLLYEDTL